MGAGGEGVQCAQQAKSRQTVVLNTHARHVVRASAAGLLECYRKGQVGKVWERVRASKKKREGRWWGRRGGVVGDAVRVVRRNSVVHAAAVASVVQK